MRLFYTLALSTSLLAFADTEDRVRKSAPAQSGGRIFFTTPMGSIRVTPAATSTVEVEAYFRGQPSSRAEFDTILKDFNLDVSQTGNSIRVTAQFQGVWTGSRRSWGGWNNSTWCHDRGCLKYSWLRELSFRITVPQQFNVETETSGGNIDVGDLKGEVRARTSGGSLHFGKIEGPVDGRTSGGNIDVMGAQGHTLVRTSGGNLRIADTTGDVDASTSGGNVRIERTTGRVDARTSGGSIVVSRAQGAVSASTSGGNIEISLADGKGYDVDAETSGGHVSSDFPSLQPDRDERNRARGAVNGGGSMVRLRTSGGGIHIRRVG